jgi:tetratricopeptide (TPR) repeat protein
VPSTESAHLLLIAVIRAIAAAAETKEVDNIYAAFAKGILASAYYAEERYEEAANEYREALKAYEQHYSGETTPDIVEQAGNSNSIRPSVLQ